MCFGSFSVNPFDLFYVKTLGADQNQRVFNMGLIMGNKNIDNKKTTATLKLMRPWVGQVLLIRIQAQLPRQPSEVAQT